VNENVKIEINKIETVEPEHVTIPLPEPEKVVETQFIVEKEIIQEVKIEAPVEEIKERVEIEEDNIPNEKNDIIETLINENTNVLVEAVQEVERVKVEEVYNMPPSHGNNHEEKVHVKEVSKNEETLNETFSTSKK